MGGVDTHDFLRLAHLNIQEVMKCKKWYKSVFFGLLDLALVNCFIVWKMMNQKKRKNMCQFDYRYELVVNLLNINIGNASTRSSRCATPTKNYRSNSNNGTPLQAYDGHEMVKFKPNEGYSGRQKRYKACFVCCNYYKTRRLAEYYCRECGVPVCIKPNSGLLLCWSLLHANEDLQHKVKVKKKNSNKQTTRNSKSNTSSSSFITPTKKTPNGKRKRSHLDLSTLV